MSVVPRSRSIDKSFFGVEEGQVTSVDLDISKEARIKVNLVRRDDNMELECRMCQPMAGNNYGFYWIPEVGDEVLVAFIQGDMRLPVILGGLYNGVDKPPAGHPKIRRIQSVNGHRISFFDATESDGGKGALVIEDAHGNTILMSKDKMVIKCVGVLEIDAPVMTLKGRVLSGGDNPI
jgi:phage baseplate assembly protein V